MKFSVKSDIDWSSFLSRHDLLWKTRPMSWDEGVFLGNGMLGVMIYGEEHKLKRNVLRFVLGRCDVIATREDGKAFPVRVPIGELELKLDGWIYQPCEIRLDLWQAEMRALITTTKGEVKLRAFTHALSPVLCVEMEADWGERGAQFEWYSYPEVDHIFKNADGINLTQYIPDIAVEHLSVRDTSLGIQSYGQDEGCTTAWKVIKRDSVDEKDSPEQIWERQVCLLTVLNGVTEQVRENAVAELDAVPLTDTLWTSWIETHRQWWHDYYPASFISIPDTPLESFYWIQMYKLASATREGLLPIDNQGPWMTSTPWPALWFNMNVQMSYSPVYTANRLEIGNSLVEVLKKQQEQLINNVPESYRHDSSGIGRCSSYDLNSPVSDEVGNLTWLLHNCWRHYRHDMDDGMLRDFLYPLLRRSIGLYLHLLEEGKDGKLHLPPMISPEYGSFKQLKTADTHYDLALLRWGCEVLMYSSNRLDIQDPLYERWADTLDRLIPFPVDETGYMIGRDLRLEFGHRHFSHLLAVFPLHIIGNDEEEREVILRSLRHWIGMEGDLRGFSFTGAASLAATLGLGDEALGYLQSLLHLIKPNTMYKEAGPVIETPLAAAESIQDMLLQSWGDRIRIFPAIPTEWKETVFHDLRAEGGFLVSAVRREGRTIFIRIVSRSGEPCRIVTDLTSSPGGYVLEVEGHITPCGLQADGSIFLELKAGKEALLYAKNHSEESLQKIAPLPAQPGKCNMYGGRKPWRLYGFPK